MNFSQSQPKIDLQCSRINNCENRLATGRGVYPLAKQATPNCFDIQKLNERNNMCVIQDVLVRVVITRFLYDDI